MAAPIIGVTAGFQDDPEGPGLIRLYLNRAYVQSVIRAGGIPVAIPPDLPEAGYAELLNRLDGVLLTGGPDIDPIVFNGTPHHRVYGIDSERDSLELALTRMAVAEKKPFLGICRGIQVINVALGGTLYTDIADQADAPLKHDYYPDYPRDHRAHPVTIETGSLLAGITHSGALRVNSLHHQAIKDLGRDLRPIAYSPDHLVEAVEVDGSHPFGLGVQWHPEAIPDDPQMQAIFRALVDAARK